MILTLPDSFIFFSWAVLHFALVCGSVPLLSGPPDSTLTVRQRSRKMAVIHFVPCHRQSFFSPPAHYLQTRLGVSAGHCFLPLSGPDSPYSRGLRLVDDPLQILSAPPASILSTPVHLQENFKKHGNLRVCQTGEALAGFFSLIKNKFTLPQKYI